MQDGFSFGDENTNNDFMLTFIQNTINMCWQMERSIPPETAESHISFLNGLKKDTNAQYNQHHLPGGRSQRFKEITSAIQDLNTIQQGDIFNSRVRTSLFGPPRRDLFSSTDTMDTSDDNDFEDDDSNNGFCPSPTNS